jgi:hypothetical protein
MPPDPEPLARCQPLRGSGELSARREGRTYTRLCRRLGHPYRDDSGRFGRMVDRAVRRPQFGIKYLRDSANGLRDQAGPWEPRRA